MRKQTFLLRPAHEYKRKHRWKRSAAALLTLMLSVMLLPKTASAVDLPSPNNPNDTIDTIDATDTLALNYGKVVDNYGTVTENLGTIVNNYGTVINNNGTIENNYGTITANNRNVTKNWYIGEVKANNYPGKITENLGTITINHGGATVVDNYGTVSSNKGSYENGSLKLGEVTNNYGTVYNYGDDSVVGLGVIGGHVENNGSADGAKVGVVYSDLGSVRYNNPGSTVHLYRGTVGHPNTGVVNRYGDLGVTVYDEHSVVYQYREVTISGTCADKVTASGLTDKTFNKYWVQQGATVTLTPGPGLYFSSPPTATEGDVAADGEAYKITDIRSDTEITVNGVSAVTGASFSALSANGGDTETTSLLTLTFDPTVTGLAAGDITVTGATKGALTAGSGAGVYTLAVSGIAADNSTVRVAVQKQGFTFSPAYREVAVRKFTPPIITLLATANTRFSQAAAPGNAVFTVTTDSAVWPLSAANFAGATLNGNALELGTPGGAAGADGAVTSGSVIVTIYPGKLNSLPPGTHTVSVALQGGVYAGLTVTGVIDVAAPGTAGDGGAAIPKTGDDTHIVPLVGSILLAGALLFVRRTRRKEGTNARL